MTRLLRTIWWILGIAFGFGGVMLVFLALPIQTWRTGRAPSEPLTLTTGGPEVGQTDRIWIDTDAACGAGSRADPDDCFAIPLLLKSRAVHIVGISTVFGNAELAVTDNTTRVLLDQFQSEQKNEIKIYSGAALPLDDFSAAAATPAREALREALAKGPLTIVGLGPLTNIAAALDQRPQLQPNVKALIAVMGRRPGHIFHPAEGAGGASFLGHGPVFRDFNFVQDKESVARIISMQLPLILVPYDAGQDLAIDEMDLAGLSLAGGGLRWIAQRFLTFSQLKERGWSSRMIERMLGQADSHATNPYFKTGRPMRLYCELRVVAIEQQDAFKSAQVEARTRSVATTEKFTEKSK